ncbi:DNA-processing protein DprA [Vagococcus zengguangii]|uniref:DNA-protecting protein DprA n=1 Tax=Vagococcus zengguangii TaxID=2571750 RepID=A0A4D7CTG0_9ENTE|nr:DNA-processing protein DprA [Vagococcus zengguangii]QCI86142.1 DNA-protecting protein DprA [Vagococcus zengguangii]TLG79841.1 DNA-protecting protein DprA [Vagococcus zengguangii]
MINENFQIFLLKHLKGVGNKGLLKLLNHVILKGTALTDCSNHELIFLLNVLPKYQRVFEKSMQYIEENQELLFEKYIETNSVTILDTDYPTLLLETYNPPIMLFYKGNHKLLQTNTLAVVGTRTMSDYGQQVTNKIVAELINQQYTIVSGLAIGIDTLAHQVAISAHGQTIAVVAHGLDRIYPRENRDLFQKMGTEQLIISEYLEGTPPQKHQFPMRNRIIAGISQGVCVMEAKRRSGSLITAQQALENNREVFAVPGSIRSVTSEGCHELIQNGAKLVSSAQHIIEEINQFKQLNVDKRLTK